MGLVGRKPWECPALEEQVIQRGKWSTMSNTADGSNLYEDWGCIMRFSIIAVISGGCGWKPDLVALLEWLLPAVLGQETLGPGATFPKTGIVPKGSRKPCLCKTMLMALCTEIMLPWTNGEWEACDQRSLRAYNFCPEEINQRHRAAAQAWEGYGLCFQQLSCQCE